MQIGDIIKHKEFRDVACEVLDIGPESVAVSWINLGFEKSWYMNQTQLIKVENKADWLLCKTPEIQCLRRALWVPLDV